MPDIMTPRQRSERMSRVKGKNSKPETRLRSLIHGLGFRFRLHVNGLPGSPDIVLPRHRKIILMHGCFWHRHRGCHRATTPQGNHEFWMKKFRENIERDRRNIRDLKALGWDVLVVWECETLDWALLEKAIISFLKP